MPHFDRSTRSISNPSAPRSERLAAQVVGRKPHAQRIQQPLDHANGPHRASHVLEQQQPPGRPQHAPRLRDRAARVRDRAQPQRAHHGVKALIDKLQRLRVAQAKIDPPPKPPRPPASDRQHLRAQLDPGQLDVGGVAGQVARRAHRQLEHTPARLLAHPTATISEQDPLKDRDLAVLVSGASILDPPNPLSLGAADIDIH
jgi:hypothetical protein